MEFSVSIPLLSSSVEGLLVSFQLHGSSHICSTGWPCQTSMRSEALGPIKAQYSSILECQNREAGVVGLLSRVSVKGIGVFRGEMRKGNII